VLWVISVLLGSFQNNIYAELATMFRRSPGGIAVYAHEACCAGTSPRSARWPPSATGSPGPPCCPSVLICGTLISAEFFRCDLAMQPRVFHFQSAGCHASLMLLLVWVFNVRVIRSTVWFSYITGILLMIPLLVMMVVPYLTGDWHAANMTWTWAARVGSGLALTWLYFMAGRRYGFEACAKVAPEYRDTATDTPKALRASAAFSVVVYALLPLGLGGHAGQ